MAEHPEIDDIDRRLKPLFRYLRAGEGACPFVIDDRAARQVTMSHHSAGRDATLVQIGRKGDEKLPLDDLAVTIRYASFVEGTAIIYDLLDETMQGKARPFECDLSHRCARMYMLMPFQIEKSSITATDADEGRIVEVAFLDARDAIIRAALPLQLRVADSSGKIRLSKYAATNRNGHLRHEVATGSGTIVVRSLLTGLEETLSV